MHFSCSRPSSRRATPLREIGPVEPHRMDASASDCADAAVDSCAHTLKAPLTLSNYGRQLQKQSGSRQTCRRQEPDLRILSTPPGPLPDAGGRLRVRHRQKPSHIYAPARISRPNRPNFIWKGSSIRETAISNQQEFSGV